MDKYDIVLDLIKYPDKYVPERIAEILSDPETREIYNLLCKTGSTFASKDAEVDVDAEWQAFSTMHKKPKFRFIWNGSRAASIVVIICTSIVAVAAGIAVTVAVIDHKPEPIAESMPTAPSTVTVSTDTVTANNTVKVSLTPIMFEDEPLEKIIKQVAVFYGVEVKFSNADAASLHLYYKFDPSLPLHEVVEQLNTFEQINIKQNGNTLAID